MRILLVAVLALLSERAWADSSVRGGRCSPPEPEVAARFAEAVQAGFTGGGKGDRMVLAHVACGPKGPLGRVVVERGSGHGHHLTITELAPAPDGVVVTRLQLGGPAIVVERGRLSRAELDALTPFVVVALSERMAIRRPPQEGGGLSLSGWGSSGDFYVRLHVDGAPVDEGAFAGYPGSDGQPEYLGLRIGAEALGKLVGAAQLAAVPLDPAARALFEDSYRVAAKRFDKPFYWWVRDLYREGRKSLQVLEKETAP